MSVPDEVQAATDAIAAVRNYVERRTAWRGRMDINMIHALDTGCESEAELTLTDLRALLARLSEYERILGPKLECGLYAVQHGPMGMNYRSERYVPCFGNADGTAGSHPVTPEYEAWMKSREES